MSPRLALALCLTAIAAHAPYLGAQTHKVATPQRVTRALGVYEWTGDLAKPAAARLIPVSLFIDSHFEDAGAYLARPVPLAVQSGDVYSVEKAGQSLGTFDIDFARNISTRHSADDNPITAWYGYGRFTPPPDPVKVAALKPSATPSVIVGGSDSGEDDRPHFVIRQHTADETTTASTTSPSPAANPAPDADPDRPTLRRHDTKDEKKPKKEQPGGYVTGPEASLNDDPNRPALRRGTPPEDVIVPQLSGMPPNLHQAVAVSDAVNADPHPFARPWESPAEHASILSTLEDLARPRIANYLTQNHLTPVPDTTPTKPAFASKPGTTNSSGTATSPGTPSLQARASQTSQKNGASAPGSRTRKPTPPPPPTFSLDSEQLTGYTLSYGGLPTFLYTVEVPVTAGGPVYLTLVAQRLPSGEVQIALSSITDATHMDRTPWLRPIDVVDPDDSHRASLLFELRAQSSRQFALYRLITAQAEQTFITNIIE